MPGRPEVVVVGCGIVGVLTAWQLLQAGATVLLVHDPDVAPTTFSSASVVRTVCDEPLLAAQSLTWYRSWNDPAASRPLFYATGVAVVLAPGAAGAAATAVSLVATAWPELVARPARPGDLPSGYRPGDHDVWFEPNAGYADAVAMAASIRRAYQANGGAVRPARVGAIRRHHRGWQIATERGDVHAARVVVACGAATPELIAEGLAPIRRQPVEVARFDRSDATDRAVVDLAHGLLVRPHDSGLLATTRAVGPDFLSELHRAALARLPRLAGAAPHLMARSEFDVTADGRPLVGQVADGLFVACGFGGGGFKTAPAVTAALVESILGGGPHPVLRRFDPCRPAGGDTPAELAALA